jgi:hypothetical protein
MSLAQKPERDRQPTRRKSLIAPAIVICAAIAVLLVVSRRVDFNTVFINGLDGTMNDQVGYISVARHLVDGHGFRSSVIYPSTLAQKTTKSYFYMPGHYVAIATSIFLFGDRVITLFLPNAAAFVLSAFLVYWIGFRLYDAAAGLFAAALYIVAPWHPVLAWSAMTEMALGAAFLAAMAIFLFLPERWRVLVGPILVVIPLLFRETGAIVAVPMCFLIVRPPGSMGPLRWGRGLLFCALTMIVVVVVMTSPIASGRPKLFINNLAGTGFEDFYTNAYSMESVDRSVGNLTALVVAKFKHNVADLMQRSGGGPITFVPGEQFAMWFILAGVPIGFLVWVVRKDWFAGGVSFAVLTVLSPVLFTYTVWGGRGLRVLLILQPFVAIIAGSLWSSVFARFRAFGALLASVLIGTLLVGANRELQVIYAPQQKLNEEDARKARFVETLGLDDNKVVVAPHHLILRYVLEHHPVGWSFIPANARTAHLLLEQFDVGAVIHYAQPMPGTVTVQELAQEGFWVVLRASYEGTDYLVLQRPEAKKERPALPPAVRR